MAAEQNARRETLPVTTTPSEPAPAKRRKMANKLKMAQKAVGLPTGSPVAPDNNETRRNLAVKSPEAVVDAEIGRYNMIVDMSSSTADYNYTNFHEWWALPSQKSTFPCLSQVAGALCGAKAGSGGLECDIGGMGDVISRRRGSLGPGMVEAAMMLKLNRDILVGNPANVKDLGARGWKVYIPKRPDYPSDYITVGEEEEGPDSPDTRGAMGDDLSESDEASVQ